MMPTQGATQREFTRALCEVTPGLTHAPLNHQFRDGLQHGPSLRGNFLSSEEHEPNTGESDHSDTYANDKQQQNGWAWFGLTGFHWCFDNDAVLLLHHDCDLNLGVRSARSNTGTVSTSSGGASDGVSSAAWRNASVVASKPVHCFVCAATGVVRAGRHLFARISFQIGCVCGHKISFIKRQSCPDADGTPATLRPTLPHGQILFQPPRGLAQSRGRSSNRMCARIFQQPFGRRVPP